MTYVEEGLFSGKKVKSKTLFNRDGQDKQDKTGKPLEDFHPAHPVHPC